MEMVRIVHVISDKFTVYRIDIYVISSSQQHICRPKTLMHRKGFLSSNLEISFCYKDVKCGLSLPGTNSEISEEQTPAEIIRFLIRMKQI
jgi:hypothetical protein